METKRRGRDEEAAQRRESSPNAAHPSAPLFLARPISSNLSSPPPPPPPLTLPLCNTSCTLFVLSSSIDYMYGLASDQKCPSHHISPQHS
ncbi:hypothetical protein M440DRAFT_1271579 [Trichoderma longibrachiatum ATCC 18648]|uniref:Uncharacterized protein n=1 Tax=Trichoderma longibrachiatum ATCC 18648 TaxID=983965 RepID=A0A2T4C109_TRILO|nr:hypothetical protein M440DRAFT_1271579 [Trichoderma longibrachiatum ATCC 18648]